MTASWPAPWTLKPTEGQPENSTDPDEISIGWDLSFGFRFNVSADDDGLTISAHFSDADLARGFVKRSVTADQLRRLSQLLGWLCEQHEGPS